MRIYRILSVHLLNKRKWLWCIYRVYIIEVKWNPLAALTGFSSAPSLNRQSTWLLPKMISNNISLLVWNTIKRPPIVQWLLCICMRNSIYHYSQRKILQTKCDGQRATIDAIMTIFSYWYERKHFIYILRTPTLYSIHSR